MKWKLTVKANWMRASRRASAPSSMALLSACPTATQVHELHRPLRARQQPPRPRAHPPSEAPPLILSPFEWTIAKRYMLPGRGEAVIALVAGIGVGVVMLSVALLVVVMSVMNGFRAELLDKIVGLNGHAIVQAYGDRKSTRLNSSHLVISYAVFCL